MVFSVFYKIFLAASIKGLEIALSDYSEMEAFDINSPFDLRNNNAHNVKKRALLFR